MEQVGLGILSFVFLGTSRPDTPGLFLSILEGTDDESQAVRSPTR